MAPGTGTGTGGGRSRRWLAVAELDSKIAFVLRIAASSPATAIIAAALQLLEKITAIIKIKQKPNATPRHPEGSHIAWMHN